MKLILINASFSHPITSVITVNFSTFYNLFPFLLLYSTDAPPLVTSLNGDMQNLKYSIFVSNADVPLTFISCTGEVRMHNRNRWIVKCINFRLNIP